MKKYLAVALCIVALASVFWALSVHQQGFSFSAAKVTVSRRVGPQDIYPPSWAGGVLDYATAGNTGQTICNKNWSTKSIRPPTSYTNKLKLQQMQQLGLKGSPADYEEDHLCSLEIGGSPTSTHNLWPEPYNASIVDGGARTKDKVENYLHTQVCQQKITPEEACKEIVQDWYKVYLSISN